MATQILLKRSSGSSFDISTCTTVLAAGEAFVDLTTKKLYIGDGTTQLKNISPVNVDSLALSSITGADDLQAIEALTGTGFLKRTGDNTWALDGTVLTTASTLDASKVSGTLTVSTTGKAGGLSSGAIVADSGADANTIAFTVGDATYSKTIPTPVSVSKSEASGNGIWRFTHTKSGTVHTIVVEDPKFADYLEADKVYMIFGVFTASFTSGDTITLQKMVSGTATTIASGITLKSTTGQNAVSNSFVSGSCSLMILSMGNSTSTVSGLFIQPAVSVWSA